MSLNKQKAFEAIKELADQSNPTEVHMATAGYPEPEKFSYHGTFGAKKYLPDAVLGYEESCDIFSIEPSLSKKVLGESLHKWILFSSSAKKKNGNLYLVVDEEKQDDFEKLLKSKMISARILPVKGG